LLRFDGYYILSDLLDVPNLHQQSTQQWRYLTERFAFGLKKIHPPAETTRGQVGLATFGAAASIYRVFVLGVIVMFIAQQFFGLGVLVVAFGAVVLGGVAVGKFIAYITPRSRLARERNRTIGVTAGSSALLLLVLAVMPLRDDFREFGEAH